MSDTQIVVLALAAVLVFWTLGAYNRLVALRNAIGSAWQQGDDIEARDGMALEAADGALLVFDSPEVNQPGLTGGFAEMAARSARFVAGPAPVHHLETQHYFAIDFAAIPADEPAPSRATSCPAPTALCGHRSALWSTTPSTGRGIGICGGAWPTR